MLAKDAGFAVGYGSSRSGTRLTGVRSRAGSVATQKAGFINPPGCRFASRSRYRAVRSAHALTGRPAEWFAFYASGILVSGLRQNGPTGKSIRNIRNSVKPVFEKYSCCSVGQIRTKTPAILSHSKGRWPSSQTWGRERWTRRLRLTSAAFAYGEVVWVRRPDAGVKFEGGQRCLQSDGVTKSRVTRTISYKP